MDDISQIATLRTSHPLIKFGGFGLPVVEKSSPKIYEVCETVGDSLFAVGCCSIRGTSLFAICLLYDDLSGIV